MWCLDLLEALWWFFFVCEPRWRRILHQLAKLAILTWRYLYLLKITFAIFFKPLLTRVMIKSVDTSVTTKMFPMTCGHHYFMEQTGMEQNSSVALFHGTDLERRPDYACSVLKAQSLTLHLRSFVLSWDVCTSFPKLYFTSAYFRNCWNPQSSPRREAVHSTTV